MFVKEEVKMTVRNGKNVKELMESRIPFRVRLENEQKIISLSHQYIRDKKDKNNPEQLQII